MAQGDPVVEALEELIRVVTQNRIDGMEVIERAQSLLERRKSGRPWRELVPEEERPLVVELLAGKLERLAAGSSRFRRAQAKALYDEGLTMEQIAELFGVTRQRVSALLKDRD
jgi:DNA-directed RNA polymerase sigma subunit (sigma70/sigma32)